MLPNVGYREHVPRTDDNGRQFKALLDYLLDGEVEAYEIYEALGVSSSTYYRRIKEADYPDAEELRKLAYRFHLSYPDLQVRFGLVSREELERYVASGPVRVAAGTALAARRPVRVARDQQWEEEAPPL
jgi:hypothetical protein